MTIEQKPFVRYNEEKKADTFTVWLSGEDRAMLENAKVVLEQPKDSTVLKQLARIGAKTLGTSQSMEILSIIFKNKRKNKRQGIVEYEL